MAARLAAPLRQLRSLQWAASILVVAPIRIYVHHKSNEERSDNHKLETFCRAGCPYSLGWLGGSTFRKLRPHRFNRPESLGDVSIFHSHHEFDCVTLAILLVGVVYGLLLRGLVELSGGAARADLLLHKVTPVLGAAYWIFFVRKGQLRPIHPLVWTMLPLAYFPYALIRGALEGRYAYPVMDVGQIGWAATAANGAMIAAGFIVAGFALVWIDGRMATSRT
jgi:hypothetical protein